MYRYAKVEIASASDSTLAYPTFGPYKAFMDQTKDRQVYSQVHLVNPTDTEFTVPISNAITTAYFTLVASDYPVMIRLVNAQTTQIQLRTNNVAATNVGSPLPDQCVFLLTGTLPGTFLTLAPISGAVQTANVKVYSSGDPTNPYT